MQRLDITAVRDRLRGSGRNPRMITRLVLGVPVVANLAAALIVLKPWAGSAEDLERRAADLRHQVRQKEIALDRLRGTVSKVETARTDGDHFMDGYLLSRRTVSSKLLSDLDRMAQTASIRQKEVTFGFEPIEGSETLTKATIVANYEGTYADLVHFLNLLDHSPRLLIIDSLGATPQPQGTVLNITMKLNAFVREGGSAPTAEVAAEEAAPEAPPVAQPTPPAPVRPPVPASPAPAPPPVQQPVQQPAPEPAQPVPVPVPYPVQRMRPGLRPPSFRPTAPGMPPAPPDEEGSPQ